MKEKPSFNLWLQPWIMLEKPTEGIGILSIEQTLLRASDFSTVHDSSPLVVVGIMRLLIAILQDTLAPQYNTDLGELWQAGHFPEDKIRAFGKQYAQRFDLFSENEPFLQTANVGLVSEKDLNLKTVAYLTCEIPSGTAGTHYRHGGEDAQVFCPVCAAKGLLTIPPFATSGGAGIKPSINGVPPVYVLPGGHNLFESLAASLVLPEDYPGPARGVQPDQVWWKRSAVVERSKEVLQVGYLNSLTFPARRVRLFPETSGANCTRCGATAPWMVHNMLFEMGESRPKDSTFWQDPFAAYRVNDKKAPVPIRPVEGKPLWREYAGLFLHSAGKSVDGKGTIRPKILDRLAILYEEGYGSQEFQCFFRVIGLRTDMKAKVFEWMDAGFDVPATLLQSRTAELVVDPALQFAQECASAMTGTFQSQLGANQGRYTHARVSMLAAYWSKLSGAFRDFVLALSQAGETTANQRQQLLEDWKKQVLFHTRTCFHAALKTIGNSGRDLRKRFNAENELNKRLNKLGRLKK